MKYKKHIATGALAISLLVGGTPVLASSPQDLGIKNIQQNYQRQNRNPIARLGVGRHRVVGVVAMINSNGFTLEVSNKKTNASSSIDVETNASTKYNQNGKTVSVSSLAVGQKVIIVGKLDRATNILKASRVGIVVN